jgi:glycosyltransferase involved in cell wall biosynthesis
MAGHDSMLGGRPFLLDVSRLVWRRWAGRLPTGIDRVCLAWLERFGGQSRAVLQWRGRVRVLSVAQSARLFCLLRKGGAGREPGFRTRFGAMLPAIAAGSRGGCDLAGRLYFNIGHTGLNHPGLVRWIAAQGLRAVFMVHDLIPVTHPEFCRPGEAARHTLRLRHALRSASGIIANSVATQEQLTRFAHAHSHADALHMLPICAAWLSAPAFPARLAPPQFDRPWFVTVGTIEARKNHLLLLQVWQKLAQIMGDATPLLVVVGQRGWEAGPAHAMLDHDPVIARHVIEQARADDTQLAGLIGGARALLMPTFAEGFGLPVIEALQSGTPVIASDLPVFREIAGAIPLLLDPADRSVWLAAVQAFCDDGPERKRQIAAMAGFRAPTWDDHFHTVETWLQQQGLYQTVPTQLAARS